MTAWTWFRELFSYKNHNLPVGVQIIVQVVAFSATVIATIAIAPSINEAFEKQKRRSEFYVKTIEALSNDTKELLGNYAVYLRSDTARQVRETTLVEIRKASARLQWRSVEFALIFDDKRASDDIERYQNSISELISYSLLIGKPAYDESKMQMKVEEFGLASTKLMYRLAKEADVSVSTKSGGDAVINLFR